MSPLVIIRRHCVAYAQHTSLSLFQPYLSYHTVYLQYLMPVSVSSIYTSISPFSIHLFLGSLSVIFAFFSYIALYAFVLTRQTASSDFSFSSPLFPQYPTPYRIQFSQHAATHTNVDNSTALRYRFLSFVSYRTLCFFPYLSPNLQ